MTIKAIFTDLDGTLIRMDEQDFLNHYLSRLCQTVAPLGYEPQTLVSAMWKGVDAVVHSDGSQSNRDTFWQTFSTLLGKQVLLHEPVFNEFYDNGPFRLTQEITKPNPMARAFIDSLKERRLRIILATNPLFPACAVKTRLAWIGLTLEDFELISTYENSRFCKPSTHYYEELLQKSGLSPAECIMIGNSVTEDILPADALGMETFLITEYASGPTDQVKNKGSFSEMMAFVKAKTSLY